MLSPRVLHISQFTLWDCLGGYANELNPRSITKVRRQRNLEVLGHGDFTLDLILAEFTSRGIRNLSDRLPVLAGLAKRYAETYHYHYLAGLSAENLPLALLWRTDAPTTKKRSIESPSWSWASVNEQIFLPSCSNEIFDTSVVSYSCRYNPPDSYSTVLDAWIHLEGPLCVVSCDDSVKDLESVAMLKLLTVPKNGDARRWKVRFDEDQNLGELKERIARRQICNLPRFSYIMLIQEVGPLMRRCFWKDLGERSNWDSTATNVWEFANPVHTILINMTANIPPIPSSNKTAGVRLVRPGREQESILSNQKSGLGTMEHVGTTR